MPGTISAHGFLWATGIEDTFVAEPHAKTSRVLDEYALTQHYERWESDIGLMADIGVSAARYGLPWYRLNPAPGAWDWEFADKTLNKMLSLGIFPIVDLVHYGTPLWMENSFLNPDYPNYASEYAARLAERFKGSVHWYTPLNEPRINAYYCGKLGFWPPHAKGWKGFLTILLNIARGIVLSDQALHAVDPEIVTCHVDATDLYLAVDDSMAEVAKHKQEIVFLALDLILGRVDQQHPLWNWCLANGMAESDSEWFRQHRASPDVLGINLYPMFSLKTLSRSGNRVRTRMPYASDRGITRQLATLYWERYGIPLMVSETASAGSTSKRLRWLEESVQDCFDLRKNNVPVIGYTWWPLFSLVAWSFLQSDRTMNEHVVHMGLYDLDRNLDRIPTSVAKDFAEIQKKFSSEISVEKEAALV